MSLLKRLITLSLLANNQQAKPFYDLYQQGIAVDDENDFGYNPSSEGPDPEGGVVEEDEEEEEAEIEEEPKEERKEERSRGGVLTARELRAELLKAVDSGEVRFNSSLTRVLLTSVILRPLLILMTFAGSINLLEITKRIQMMISQ